MKKVLFAFAFGAIMVVACNKEQEISKQPAPVKTITIRASGEAFDGVNLDGATKGTMDVDGTFRWAASDQIGVRLYKGEAYLGTDSGSGYGAWDGVFTLDDDSAGMSSGSFSCSTSVDEWVHWGYAAFYPKFSNNVSNSDGKVYFELKKVYESYTSGSCLMPMVANLNNPDNGGLNGRPVDMKLKHVGAGVRVTLKDVPGEANQASLTVTGKNIVNGDGNTAWYGVNPANAGTDFISATDGPENTVYLKFDKDAGKRDITFIFPLPTVDLSGGIELKLYYDSGASTPTEFWSRKATGSLPALTRGQLLDMPELTIPVTPEEASAPIWIDGKINDWKGVPHVFKTTDARIVEWKYTNDDNNLFFLFKVPVTQITADDNGSYKWGSYICIGFDTDSSTGKNGGRGLGDGMEYRALIFPWRGNETDGRECFVGVDTDGNIDNMMDEVAEIDEPDPKIASKIDGDFSYVEVRIPFSQIGNPTGPVNVQFAMHWYPTAVTQIMPEIVTINATDQTVEVGKTVEIGATANSVNPITYLSGDTSVATIDADGVITGVAEGTTTITLSVAEDSVNGFTSATKVINVSVTSPYTPAITIDGDMSDWSGITAFSSEQDSRIREWKFKSDSQQVYFYFVLRKDRVDSGKILYIGFDTDNDATSGSTYGSVPGCSAYVSTVPFTNIGEGTQPEPIDGNDTASKVYVAGVHELSGLVFVKTYDDGSAVSSSSSIFIELSIPRNKLNLPVAGESITVGCSYGWYVTGTQSITLE